jgi:surfeit locus 1 family protein
MPKALFIGRRLWMTLLVLVGVAVLCRLGVWQLDRLAQRRAINARIDMRMVEPATPLSGEPIDPEAIEYRRVKVRGVYDSAQAIVLRNRTLDGAPGVHVLMPLRIAGSDKAVLIDRGWLPLDQAAPEARRAFDEAGEIAVEGIARLSQENAGGPQDPPLGPDRTRLDAWFRVDIPRIQQQIGYSLLPLFLEQQPTLGDPPLPRRVPTTDLGEGPHLSYAIQWFAFAIILLVGYVAFTYQQVHRATTNPSERKYRE